MAKFDGGRLANSVRNGAYGLVFYALTLVLSFVSNRVFVHRLGADMLGLCGTVSSIVETLNIAELGVGMAMASILYVPLASGDRETVAELVAVQGWIYRRVAVFVALAAVVVMFFFPSIFAGAAVPLPYAYATCVVMLMGSLSTYLLNYRDVVLSANQQEYAVTLAYRLPSVLRLVLQILAVEFTDHGYELWLLLQLGGMALTAVMVRGAVARLHPYMCVPVRLGGALRLKFPEVGRMVGQVFAHRLASVVLVRVSPMVVFAFTSLHVVAAYGSYMMISGGLTALFTAVSGGVQGSVGHLVAQGDSAHSRRAFDMMFAVTCVIAAVCAYGFYAFADPFVSAWVGADMVLGGAPVTLMSVMVYIAISRCVVGQFLSAHGFYADVWAAFAEAFLNVGLSVSLGLLWGLSGVLLGVVVSLVVIVLCWKPYYLFCVRLGCGVAGYWWAYVRNAALTVAVGWCVSWLCGSVVESGFGSLLWRMAWQTALYGVLVASAMCVASSGMRAALRRGLSLCLRRGA